MWSDKYSQRPLCEHRVPGLDCRVGTWLSSSCAVRADEHEPNSLGYREYRTRTEQTFPRWDIRWCDNGSFAGGFHSASFLAVVRALLFAALPSGGPLCYNFCDPARRAQDVLGLCLRVLGAGAFWLKRRWVHVRRKLFVHERICEYGTSR